MNRTVFTFSSVDDTLLITQSPVSAADGLDQAWHMLGFSWDQRYPDKVFLQVGVSGIENVMGVTFKLKDREIAGRKASILTDYGDQSYRRFVISLEEFIAIANAGTVKMKVSQIDTYTVSTFGNAHTGAIVSSKLSPFLERVSYTQRQLRRASPPVSTVP
jgi:hypothetical protein